MTISTAIQLYEASYLMPAFENATVSDAMHPGIVSCELDATSTEIARMMATHHVHCVAALAAPTRSPDESYVWGIVSDLDLIAAGVRDGAESTARDLAAQPIISVKPTMPLRHAVELMLENQTSHVVVTDPANKRPIGVLSSLDIAGVLAWGRA